MTNTPPSLCPCQARWVMDRAGPGYAQPQHECHTINAESQPEFERLSQHFSGSVVGIRNVMLQAWFANALARPRTSRGARAELAAIKAAYDELSGRPAPRVFAAFNAHARGVMRCGSGVEFLSGLRLGLRLAAGSGNSSSPRGLFVAILSQAVLDSFDAGYHRGPSPYAGADRALCEQHKLRRQQEKQMLQAVAEAAAEGAADAGGAAEAASDPVEGSTPVVVGGAPVCLEGVEEGEGSGATSWVLACQRERKVDAIVNRGQRVGSSEPRRVAVERGGSSEPRRVVMERVLCFVSWELRPIGVVSDVWM